MTIPFVCVLIALLLIVLSRVPVSMAMGQQEGGYNNHAPRDQQAQLAGWGRRALAAHQNTIEAFPPFAAGVIISYLAKASLPGSTVLCLVFVAARIAYPILYIADHDKARSLVWVIGLLATVALYILPWLS
jgi:uncharacterized MAPEG superfamily protein